MATPSEQKLPLSSLTTMVIGSMVGAGIFNLPGRFATATGEAGAAADVSASAPALGACLARR